MPWVVKHCLGAEVPANAWVFEGHVHATNAQEGAKRLRGKGRPLSPDNPNLPIRDVRVSAYSNRAYHWIYWDPEDPLDPALYGEYGL